jgi:hypothetical protein
LPTTKNASFCSRLYRPRYAKKRIWKIGPISIVGMYIEGLIQLNSPRYAIRPPMKKIRMKAVT